MLVLTRHGIAGADLAHGRGLPDRVAPNGRCSRGAWRRACMRDQCTPRANAVAYGVSCGETAHDRTRLYGPRQTREMDDNDRGGRSRCARVRAPQANTRTCRYPSR